MNLIPAALLAVLLLPMPAHATAAAPLADAGGDTDTPPATVYMVVRVKLTGTDFTQVVFFNHSAITTLEACEAERQAGLSTGWNYFSRHYLKTLKGISYKVDYRCVASRQRLAPWRPGVPLDNFYLVRTADAQLEVTPQRNFFACRDALQATGASESVEAFCAISSQRPLAAAARD